MTESVSTDAGAFAPAVQEHLFSDAPPEVGRARPPASEGHAEPAIAILGLGYVGLPTALAARAKGARTIGIDVSESRLRAIRENRVDLVDADRALLERELADEHFTLTASLSRLGEADAVLICVPTPVDEHRNPDLHLVAAACAEVVAHARAGQTIILTSTSYPGTTRDLLADPLAARGFTVGEDVFVASSPERIDPGNVIPHADVPRVVGGVTQACTQAAVAVLRLLTDHVVPMTSPEAAEMTKLLENSFRAVNIAFANEIADVCTSLGIDAREIIDAAATKPYGFMPFYPGTGVGGHCIPCDPHYLLWELRSRHAGAPLLTAAMQAIADRPFAIVEQVVRELSFAGRGIAGARVLVVGVAYKPGVEDVRESPALEILGELLERGARVDFFDPHIPRINIDEQQILLSVTSPEPRAYDAIVVNTIHPRIDYGWLHDARLVIDPSGRFQSHPERHASNAEEVVQPERRIAERRAAFRVGR